LLLEQIPLKGKALIIVF